MECFFHSVVKMSIFGKFLWEFREDSGKTAQKLYGIGV